MSTEPFDLVITGGTLHLPAGPNRTDVGVRGGRIAAFGDLSEAPARDRLTAAGLDVLPGLLDVQVHFREPGATHKEDLATGTAAAALGGITGVFEMPNTNPSTTTAEALEEKFRLARGRARVDHAFFVGATPENADELGTLERMPGCAGVKVFMGSSTGSLLVHGEGDLERVLRSGRRRVAVHAEDEERLIARKPLAIEAKHPRAHPEWRDAESALLATQRIVRLAEAAGRPLHILHCTTAEELEFLAGKKHIATVEVPPQHLTFAAPEIYERLGTRAQMNPPIRSARHRDALWAGITNGLVDILATDHAPHTLEEKAKPYPESPSGMPGVQTMVPVMLDHVNAGRLSLARLIDLLAYGPARVYGLPTKGRIAVGYDGDFTIVDLKARQVLNDAMIASRCGWTPFDGMEVQGKVIATVVRGTPVVRDGALSDAAPIGRPIPFAFR